MTDVGIALGALGGSGDGSEVTEVVTVLGTGVLEGRWPGMGVFGVITIW